MMLRWSISQKWFDIMNYQLFAQVYDEIMDEKLYEHWALFVDEQVQSKQGKLLELACGTGALAIFLINSGYDVTGLDLSGNMLSLADERAKSKNLHLPLIERDMQDLTGIGSYDIVTCFSDSLCYLPDSKALLNVFQEISKILEKEGHFLFDVHSLYQMDKVYPGYMYNYQSEEVSFLWQSFAGQQKHSIEHDLTFFVYDQQFDLYERYDETHKERTYPVEVYLELLQKAGFSSVSVYGEFGEAEINDETTRWFFSCQK